MQHDMTTSKRFYLKCVRMVFLDKSSFFLISVRVCLSRNENQCCLAYSEEQICKQYAMVSDSTQLIPFFIINNFHWWEFLRPLMLLKIVFWSPPPAPTIKHLKYLLLQLLDYLLVKTISEYPSPYPGFQPILAARDTYVCFTKYI